MSYGARGTNDEELVSIPFKISRPYSFNVLNQLGCSCVQLNS